jgi:hypothetical protein
VLGGVESSEDVELVDLGDILVAEGSVEPVLPFLVVGEKDLLADVGKTSDDEFEQLAAVTSSLVVRVHDDVLQIEDRDIVRYPPYDPRKPIVITQTRDIR